MCHKRNGDFLIFLKLAHLWFLKDQFLCLQRQYKQIRVHHCSVLTGHWLLCFRQVQRLRQKGLSYGHLSIPVASGVCPDWKFSGTLCLVQRTEEVHMNKEARDFISDTVEVQSRWAGKASATWATVLKNTCLLLGVSICESPRSWKWSVDSFLFRFIDLGMWSLVHCAYPLPWCIWF